MHTEPAVACAEKGYHILLEKPIAPTAEECRKIVSAAKRNRVIFAVCHALRYTDYTQKLKEVLNAGTIGDIISMQHIEEVGWWHQAHSFVRGNWRNEKESSFMLLAKSCHDIDWISYIMRQKCRMVSSFGSLKHFRREEKPAFARGGRKTRIFGSRGELCGDGSEIRIFDFLSEQTTTIATHASDGTILGSHGGGDYKWMDRFVTALAENDPTKILSGPDDALASHLLVFAAEKARRENKVVHMP